MLPDTIHLSIVIIIVIMSHSIHWHCIRMHLCMCARPLHTIIHVDNADVACATAKLSSTCDCLWARDAFDNRFAEMRPRSTIIGRNEWSGHKKSSRINKNMRRKKTVVDETPRRTYALWRDAHASSSSRSSSSSSSSYCCCLPLDDRIVNAYRTHKN